MSYDPYGRPIGGTPMHQQYANPGPHHAQYGDPYAYGAEQQQPAPEHQRQALLSMPTAGQLGGPAPISFVRFPYYPTSPFYSTNPNVGYQTRFYGQSLLYTDNDYQVGSESIRVVQFDIPCRLIAFNGSALYYFGSPAVVAGLPLGVKANDTYLFRAEYTTGDKLHTGARLGSTVVGSDENPGEIGGAGYTIDAGASFVLGITPLMANLRIDVTLVCLEMRGPRNFSR
jgi:hypothetical protein